VRAMAMIYVAIADAEIACFESKYFYQTWRPHSAITLAIAAGNAETASDPKWTPVLPTPPHPEYPAAHSCVAGALGEVLKAVYDTSRIAFSFDSGVTKTTHTYASPQDLADEIAIARIAGGMHFRTATVIGYQLGARVGHWVVEKHFRPR
jgi:hypothetical protein